MSEQDKPNQSNAAMQDLRNLLFEKESARITAIEELLNNPELHAQEIAKVLAEAVRLRSKGDDKFVRALRPAVESAITASIHQNPKPLSDALFPVMGPAIRKAINHSIASMLQSLNQTLEYSFSAKGLRWRLDAFRTGKSFAEVVLLNTLLYRVEQVFLIHKETGLLLKHISFDPALHEDADMVSSMLTAVRDFIHDSFAAGSNQETQNLRLGDLEIIVEQAPDVVLAVVCRGNAPRSLHDAVSVVIEDIQQEFHAALQIFDGDAASFEACDEVLSTLMVADYASQQKKGSANKILAFVGLLVAALCAWWGWNFYQEREYKAHWQGYIEQLRSQPGVVITNVLEKDGVYTLSGLRDPLSVQPASLLSDFQLHVAQARYQFQTYYALEPSFVLQRAIKILQPPSTVTLKLQKETLFISGSAPSIWIEESKKKALWVAGIESVDISQLSESETLLDRIIKAIQPPQSIRLQLMGHELTLKGEATQAWVANAAMHIQALHEVVSYNDTGVIRIDSVAHLLAVAKQVLQPPSSIQLKVTKDKVLVLQGSASQDWIGKVQKKARAIRFIKRVDMAALQLSDEDILQAAREQMRPPSTVKFHVSDGRLFAEGSASIVWIEQARKDAQRVKGVLHFVDKDLVVAVSPWQRIARQVQAMQLASSTRHPTLTQSDKVKLRNLVLLYKDSLKFDSTTRIDISSAYDQKTKLVARMRLSSIYKVLINHNLSPENIHTHLQLKKGKEAASVRFKLVSAKILP